VHDYYVTPDFKSTLLYVKKLLSYDLIMRQTTLKTGSPRSEGWKLQYSHDPAHGRKRI